MPAEQRLATQASLSIGSAPNRDIAVNDDGVLQEHVVIYLHRLDDHSGEIRFRCPHDDASVVHNGEPAHTGVLNPGDVIEVGTVRLGVEHLP